jgi:hypothetical protein
MRLPREGSSNVIVEYLNMFERVATPMNTKDTLFKGTWTFPPHDAKANEGGIGDTFDR